MLTMQVQEAARANRNFFAAGGLRAVAAALPRVSLRIATDRPPRSDPIPRRHNSWLSRSQWPSSDRPFAALAGPDACAAAKGSVSGSSRDAHGRGCEAAARYGGSCAEVRQVQSAVGVRLEEIFQSSQNSRAPPVSIANLDPLAFAQALDYYSGQRLL